MENRDRARAEIARRQLAVPTVERIVRECFASTPINVVEKTRQLLARFLSGAAWNPDDDRALAASVGPGDGWIEESLAPDLTIAYGWRAGVFRVEPTIELPDAVDPANPKEADATIGHTGRTLGDTFEDAVLLEAGRTPAELRLVTGPGTGGSGTYTRAAPGDDPRVGALFESFPQLEGVALGPGTVALTVDNGEHWHDVIVPLYAAITMSFVPARVPPPPDRQLERARTELRGLRPGNPRDLAKLLEAAQSELAAFRRVAVEQLAGGEWLVVSGPWKRALEDSSRVVRRAVVRTMTADPRPEHRPLYEQALADKDACVRYYALRGIAALGVGQSAPVADRRLRDDDVRVRLAAAAIRAGLAPA